jgi:hypothetical protein
LTRWRLRPKLTVQQLHALERPRLASRHVTWLNTRALSKPFALLVSALVMSTGLVVVAPPRAAVAASPSSSKLVVIPFENQAYDDIVGSSQAPYLNHLISQGTLFSNYSAVASGSNPNYLAMTSGLMSALSPPSPNVFQAIDGTTGLTWKEFMESMTGTCATGSTGNVPGSTDPLYTADHDPAYSYRANTSCLTNDVPLTTSTFNLANLPSLSYVVPNECDDMHTALPAGQSCPAYFGPNGGTSQVNVGDNWLAAVVPSLLAQPNVTVLITFDESEGTTVPWEHIVTLEVGAGVTAGGIDGNGYTHFGLEAGLYRYFNLGAAPNAGSTSTPLPIPAAPPPLYAGPPNDITQENSNPGTTNWKISQQADDTNQQIDGYASATSVSLGQPISLYVSVSPQQTYTMDFYRLGYYQGLGGRLMLEVPNLAGVVQPGCPPNPATGLIACNWSPSYQLTIPTSWVSGVYLVKLTNAAGYQAYINFVVRDDARHSPLLYQVAFNTYAAYNNWPADVPSGSSTGLPLTGKSLYDYNSSPTLTSSGTQRAVQVSFDRPLSTTDGAFLDYDINTVAWLEQQGYDVTYSSDVDTDLSGSALLNHHGFISATTTQATPGTRGSTWRSWARTTCPGRSGMQPQRPARPTGSWFATRARPWIRSRTTPPPFTSAIPRSTCRSSSWSAGHPRANSWAPAVPFRLRMSCRTPPAGSTPTRGRSTARTSRT